MKAALYVGSLKLVFYRSPVAVKGGGNSQQQAFLHEALLFIDARVQQIVVYDNVQFPGKELLLQQRGVSLKQVQLHVRVGPAELINDGWKNEG